jgi:hypothetical protein
MRQRRQSPANRSARNVRFRAAPLLAPIPAHSRRDNEGRRGRNGRRRRLRVRAKWRPIFRTGAELTYPQIDASGRRISARVMNSREPAVDRASRVGTMRSSSERDVSSDPCPCFFNLRCGQHAKARPGHPIKPCRLPPADPERPRTRRTTTPTFLAVLRIADVRSARASSRGTAVAADCRRRRA